ncbi:hypothetical protein LZ30DRAFT_695003 [Colletotrichum cereale]|nr:hypothetical protein LZ30DRAFT_695003 [Colletotrichum cereale]
MGSEGPPAKDSRAEAGPAGSSALSSAAACLLAGCWLLPKDYVFKTHIPSTYPGRAGRTCTDVGLAERSIDTLGTGRHSEHRSFRSGFAFTPVALLWMIGATSEVGMACEELARIQHNDTGSALKHDGALSLGKFLPKE